ncbi:hypothetical protein AAULR_22989, partial [Lacticaseibacillus rhamnosus MTCC 5462]
DRLLIVNDQDFFAIIGPPWFKIHFYSITVLKQEREQERLAIEV